MDITTRVVPDIQSQQQVLLLQRIPCHIQVSQWKPKKEPTNGAHPLLRKKYYILKKEALFPLVKDKKPIEVNIMICVLNAG